MMVALECKGCGKDGSEKRVVLKSKSSFVGGTLAYMCSQVGGVCYRKLDRQLEKEVQY